jgi:mRNA interferase RelE/StbE
LAWKVSLTNTAQDMLAAISDRRLQEKILTRIEGLEIEPEKQGKPLVGELSGLRSLRTGGQRYRIIYKVDKGQITVLVIAIGIRRQGSKKDIYELAQKLVRLGLSP